MREKSSVHPPQMDNSTSNAKTSLTSTKLKTSKVMGKKRKKSSQLEIRLIKCNKSDSEEQPWIIIPFTKTVVASNDKR